MAPECRYNGHEIDGRVIVGRWTLGTVQAKKGPALLAALNAVELPVDEDLEADAGAQAQLDACRAAILVLADAIPGELHVTANGYAAKGGKRAGELPTSFVSITLSVVDAKTGAPRTWVQPVEGDPDPIAPSVVEAPAAITSSSGATSSSSNQAMTS